MNYEIRIKDGVTTYYPEIAEGVYSDVGSTTPPAGAVAAYKASRVGKLYTPEATKRTLNLVNINKSKSRFFFSCDARPDEYKHADWLNAGASRLSQWTSNDATGSKFSEVPDNIKFVYQTESDLHGDKEGFWYWASTLAQMQTNYVSRINAWGMGVIWFANEETSNYWQRWYHDPNPGNPSQSRVPKYPLWDTIKNVKIQLESQVGEMTVEQLFNSPILAQEIATRRANRVSLMLLIAKRGGADVGYGSAIYQGNPSDTTLTSSSRYLDDAEANVNNIGGSNGTITLNGTTYTGLTGSFYKHETVHLHYFYYQDTYYNGQPIGPLFQNGASAYNAETNYPNLYAKLADPNPFAREVGARLGVEKRLKDIHGGATIPIVRMSELFYENDLSRVPNGFGLAGTYFDGGSPKVWILPDTIRTQYLAAYFMSGEEDKSGWHTFYSAGADGSPNQGIIYNKDSIANLNHEWHTLSTLFAARRDMEAILDKTANTVRTTDLDIKVGNTGSFQRLNGVDSWNQNKPCFVTRHKTTSAGTAVLIMGGYGQDKDVTRTDLVQIPGVGNGCSIELTYKGPSTIFFECLFPAGVSNQVITAQSIIPAQTKPGYGGRINQ